MARGFYKKRHNVGESVPFDKLRIGMLIHLSYTNFGCVWQISSIEEDSKGEIWLNLLAPESRKSKRTRAIYAVYTRREQR